MCSLSHLTVRELWTLPGSQWLHKLSLLSPVTVFHQTSDLFCVWAAWVMSNVQCSLPDCEGIPHGVVHSVESHTGALHQLPIFPVQAPGIHPAP